MTSLVVFPLLLPLLTATLCVALWKKPDWQRWVSLAGSTLLLGTSVDLLLSTRDGSILVMQLGSWPAPFGISVVADWLGALMVFGTGLVAFCASVFAIRGVRSDIERFGYHPLFQLLVFGVCGAFVTGDLFNLYVWFEVLLMASFVLMTLGGSNSQLKAGFSYVLLNFIASVFFLSALGLLYANVGTLNMADLAVKLRAPDAREALLPAISLLFVGFAIKAGVFPLFSWLPISYHTPSPLVAAVFGGLLTKVGVYSLLRLFTTIYPIQASFFQEPLVLLSVLTMVIGVLCAAAQFNIRRILSVHIVSQVGYMTLALAFYNSWGIAAVIFFIFHQMVVKTNLFFVGAAVEESFGTSELKELGGLYKHYPFFSVLFFVSALALAGIPPLSGFVAKLLVIKSGFAANAYWSVGAALAVSVLTLYSMAKIWNYCFWSPLPSERDPANLPKIPTYFYLPVTLMTLLSVALGVGASWILGTTEKAAAALIDQEAYIEAVLRGF